MSGWKIKHFLFIGVSILTLSGCAKREPAAGGSQVLRVSQRNEPATLDPHLATLPDEFFIIRALSEGLLTPAPDGGAPLPGAAEKWSVSPDGLTCTFHLRPDAKWSNGDPVTAGDFVYSIQRALTPALAAPKAALFFPLRNARAFCQGKLADFSAVGVRATGDHQLELTLAEPAADFLAMVASGPWIPVHRATVERHGTDWTRPGNFTGNGPFILTAWRPNQEIIVQRNPAYWDAAEVKLPEIRFVAFDNGDTEERAFRAGQVDVTMAVPSSKLATYRAGQPTRLHQVHLNETRYLALNTQRPPLDDPRVRRALSLALNRAELVEKVLLGGPRPALNFIPAGLGGYVPATQISEDPAEARRLLAEAGFPGGRGFPKLELATWPVSTAQLEALQQMWQRELGIEVTLAPREARTHLAALAAGDYTIALVTAIPDYDGATDLFTDLRSGDPGNYPHWRNAEFDRLVAEGGRLAAVATRNTVYQQAEKLLLDELPLIPLYFNSQNFLVSPRVKNWQTDRLWTRFYRNISVE
ncbi:MAG TPA: peptide ABC transporter substrate-binding protein [Lacunisphaera sp.]|nr:peptide ABC transporter substrate-binding protein [Lacunisphaera sp.]